MSHSTHEAPLDWLSICLWCYFVSGAGCSSSPVKHTAEHIGLLSESIFQQPKGFKKERQKLRSIQPLCSTPLRAPWYVGEKLSDKTTSPARLREMVGEDERRGEGGRERECKRVWSQETVSPNLYVLTKTTYSLKLPKAFTIS